MPLLTQTDRIMGWAVGKIPVDIEKKLGAQAFGQYRGPPMLFKTITPADVARDATVNDVLCSITHRPNQPLFLALRVGEPAKDDGYTQP